MREPKLNKKTTHNDFLCSFSVAVSDDLWDATFDVGITLQLFALRAYFTLGRCITGLVDASPDIIQFDHHHHHHHHHQSKHQTDLGAAMCDCGPPWRQEVRTSLTPGVISY